MSDNNFVSFWVGVARSNRALRACVTQAFTEDGDCLGSPFSRAFGVRHYHDGLLEAHCRKGQTTRIETLLRGASYDEVIVPRLQKAGTIEDPVNCFVLLYDHRHSGRLEWAAPDVALTFVGAVKYR
jgi:hypothetical protein